MADLDQILSRLDRIDEKLDGLIGLGLERRIEVLEGERLKEQEKDVRLALIEYRLVELETRPKSRRAIAVAGGAGAGGATLAVLWEHLSTLFHKVFGGGS